MIFIFGDSHARLSTQKLNIPHINFSQNSKTMHRVGRDNQILGFQSYMNNKDNTFIFFYGEIDCRCHIYKQIELGRFLEEITETLTENYIKTIKNNIKYFNKIIINSVIPPVNRHKHEKRNGPMTPDYPYPILGSNEVRVSYTKLVNKKLKEKCEKEGYIFLDTYDFYSEEDGTFRDEFSDCTCVHMNENSCLYLCEQIKILVK